MNIQIITTIRDKYHTTCRVM